MSRRITALRRGRTRIRCPVTTAGLEEHEPRRSMPSRFSIIVLWLFVINLGIALGAGLYESQIVVPRWIDPSRATEAAWDAEAARNDDPGLRFWAYVTTGPLTLLVLASLLAALRADGRLRRWWLAAAGLALAERIFTFSYFIPTMIGLMATASTEATVSTAVRWASLNHLRHALMLLAAIAALRAFAVLYEERATIRANSQTDLAEAKV